MASLTAIIDDKKFENCMLVGDAHDTQPMIAFCSCTTHQGWQPMQGIYAIHHSKCRYYVEGIWLILFFIPLQALIKFKSHLYFEEKDLVQETENALTPCKGTKVYKA